MQAHQNLGQMNKGFANFKAEALNIHQQYPKLTYSESEDGVSNIFGELELNDDEGGLIDSYFIRIQPTPDYPLRFPFVFETKGRIPVNIDWHVFPDGHCCIKAIPEEIIICKHGITLLQFMTKQVVPYFFNQKYRELHGYFLNERSHGIKGSIEFFKDAFKTDNLKTIAKSLLFIKNRNEPIRTAKCFCGSEEKYRKCHRETFRLLNLFNDEELNLYIQMVISAIPNI